MGTPQQVALRCRIVLGSWRGESEAAIASELEINRQTVRLWRERFSQAGLSGLWEIAPGRGRKATYGPDRVGGSRCHLAIQAQGADALELPPHGGESGHQQVHRQQPLAKP